MNITVPEAQRQEFECFCADNDIDPLTLRGLSVWEGWKAAYLANTPVLVAAPTPPAQEQATMCACCLEHKPTPLRIDRMGGYVCLTCIDRELTPPAPEVEPVGYTSHYALSAVKQRDELSTTISVTGRKYNAHNIPLYLHPANDGLRKAAEEIIKIWDGKGRSDMYGRAVENLRAELNKDKSC